LVTKTCVKSNRNKIIFGRWRFRLLERFVWSY